MTNDQLLKAGKFVLIAHGTTAEVAHAREILGIARGEFSVVKESEIVF
jgi:hypothetical protein